MAIVTSPLVCAVKFTPFSGNFDSRFFGGHHYGITRTSVWHERTLQPSIRSLSFPAVTHSLPMSKILTLRQDGACLQRGISCDLPLHPGQTLQTGSDSSENNLSAHADSFRYGMHGRMSTPR